MRLRNLCNILSLVLCLLSFADANAKAKADSIYCGTQLKLDIASPIVMSAANNWKIQHYELAVNVRLAKRFYPTFEAGYSGGQTTNDTILYRGQGGFFRIGADLCPFKKHPESPHALLVGVRLGTAAQQWQHPDYGTGGVRGDCWGEIVAGCQVEIAKVNKTSLNCKTCRIRGVFPETFSRCLLPPRFCGAPLSCPRNS